MEYIKWMDENPKWLKIVLALPILSLTWVIYRLIKSFMSKNTLQIIVAIWLLVFGIFFLWLIDIITLVLQDRILWF